MINPLIYPLTLFRNADYGEEFFFSESGVALDFTGYSGEFQIRYYEGAPGAVLAAGSVSLAGGGGSVAVTVTRASIDALPAAPIRGGPATFRYDLRLRDAAGLYFDYLRGPVTVFSGVTAP